eukprot:15480292-Alexandrium_andersonii.AAC.1
MREKTAQTAPLQRASEANFEVAPGPAQFQVRTPEAILECSINDGATRFDRPGAHATSGGSRGALEGSKSAHRVNTR